MVFDGDLYPTRYVRKPLQREPDFGATSVIYSLAELLLAQRNRNEKREQRSDPRGGIDLDTLC